MQKTIKAMKTSWALDIFPESKTYTVSLHWLRYPLGGEGGFLIPLRAPAAAPFPSLIVFLQPSLVKENAKLLSNLSWQAP